MRQIRNGVFETNSSSMHSIVIKKNGGYYTNEEINEDLWLLDDGIWDIWRQEEIEFGRYPFKCLATFESKVRYAIASLCRYRYDCADQFKKIEDIVIEVVWGCTGIKLPQNRWDYDELYYGYVDEDIISPFLTELYSVYHCFSVYLSVL